MLFKICRTSRLRVIQSLRTVHNEIGALALFGIGHLAGKDRFEFLGRHSRAGQGAGALNVGRSRNDDDYVDFRLAPRLEQQGNIKDDEGRAFGAMHRSRNSRCARRTKGWTIASSSARR